MIDNYETYKTKVLQEDPTTVVWTGAINCAPEWNILLAPLPSVPQECPVKCKNKQGNNPMDDKVYYLENRVYNIESVKDDDIQKQFGMKNAPQPRKFDELVAAIKAGNYIAPAEGYKAYNVLDGVQWRFDNTPKDEAGYKLASEALKKAKTTAMDAVHTQDPATAGLAAVQAFEAWAYTAPSTTVN